MSRADELAAATPLAVAPSTLRELHQAIKARLVVALADFWLLSTKTGHRAPAIVDGWLPPKLAPVAGANPQPLNAEQFPFVIVRPRMGTDSEPGAEQASTAVVDLVIGTYSDTDDGWLDVLDVIQAIRLDFHGNPTIAGTAFEHTGPLSWHLADEHPDAGQKLRPQWLGAITTTWTIPRPRRVDGSNQ